MTALRTPPTATRRRWTTARAVAVALALGGGTAVAAPGAAGAADPIAPLEDIAISGSVSLDVENCNPDGRGTITFTATGPVGTTYPSAPLVYGGTWTETGTATFGPTVGGQTPIVDYDTTFTITAPDASVTVTGTTTLAEPSLFFASFAPNGGECIVVDAFTRIRAEYTYTATIVTAAGTRTDVGRGKTTTSSSLFSTDLESTGWVQPQPAGPISLRATAVVETTNGVTGVAAGDPLVFDYTYEGSTAASSVVRYGATYPAVTALSARVGPYEATASGSITVFDVPTGDFYRVDAVGPFTETGSISTRAITSASLFLDDAGATAFATPLLPLVAPDPAAFGSGSISLTFRETGCVFFLCSAPHTVVARITTIVPLTADPDGDDDGVVDAIGSGVIGGFDDGSGTVGQILSGTGILVEDAVAPAGVRITTTAAATVRLCDTFTVTLAAGSDATFTCGSVTVTVTTGTVTIAIDNGTVTATAGSTVTVDELANGSEQVRNLGTVGVTVTRGGVATTLAAGATTFSAPQTLRDCQNGGWRAYGTFTNEGRCIASTRRR